MVENAAQPDAAIGFPSARRFKKAKRRSLIGLLVFATVMGVAEQLLAASDGFDGILTVVVAVGGILFIASWCQYDSGERQYTIRKPLLLLIICVAVIGLPVYFFITRGIRGIYSCVLALAFLVLVVLLEQFAIEVTYRLQSAML